MAIVCVSFRFRRGDFHQGRPVFPLQAGEVSKSEAAAPAPAPFTERTDGLLELWFCRVSVCDAFFVRCNGETMMIDGGTFNTGKAALKVIDQLGLTGVDYLFNTHHDDDHLEMQKFLLQHDFTAKVFLTPYERNYPVARQREMEKIVDAVGVEYRTIHDGDSMMLGGENGAKVQFFRWGGSTNPNFSSVMCKITFGERSVFMMADVISAAQDALAEERLTDIPWKADILKAGHHGYTRQNTALVQAIDPELCIVTNSKLGGEATISQMDKLGIPVILTNLGTIYLHTDGGENWYFSQDKSYLE